MVLFFLLILSPVLSKANVPISSTDSVTCSLDDYKSLFRQAFLQELKKDTERERKELRQDFERKQDELRVQRDTSTRLNESKAQRDKIIPGNWQLVSHSAEGSCRMNSGEEEVSMAAYNFSLEFTIFEDEWTAIPIIDSQAIVSDWQVLRAEGNSPSWEPVELGQNTLLVLKRRESGDAESLWKDHTLVTNSSGRYKVQFRSFFRVRNNRNLNSLQINLLYPLAFTRLRLLHVEAGHIKELNVEPHAYFEVTGGQNHSDIHIRLPASTAVEVKWRVQFGSQQKKHGSQRNQSADHMSDGNVPFPEMQEELRSAMATVTHDAMHSIADGILQSSHTLKYVLDSEQSLNSVEILVGGLARVSSVVAHGIQTWHSSQSINMTSSNNHPEASTGTAVGNITGTLVHVTFKSSVISKEAIVMINTELEFDVEAGIVSLPPIVCHGVLRQTGTVAVVKVANVEVYEHSSHGIVRSSADDIPTHVRSRTGRPIVLAYKFLSPRYAVALSVIHHQELRTLDAVVDAALHKILVLETQTMMNLLLILQNTQRQYMEVRGIPPDATLWSLKVNSVDTKPVRGRNGALMVPLLVGAAAAMQDDASSRSSVELAWLLTHSPLGNNGSIDLAPPQLDVPISALSVEVQFPNAYDVHFTGSLMRVSSFSQKQPSSVSYETGSSMIAKDFDFPSMPPPGSASSSREGVKAKVPRLGRRYAFEKLLVVNDSASLSASYGPPPSNTPSNTSIQALWDWFMAPSNNL